MQKDDLNVHVLPNRNWGTFHRKALEWKKIWAYNHQYLFSNRRIFAIYLCCTCGKVSSEDPIKVFSSWILLHRYYLTILIMVTEQFYWRKILCGCFRFIWLWLLIAIMNRCAERMSCLSTFILFQLQCWIILRVSTNFLFRNFHAKRVIMEIAMMKILNNCIAGRLNNNYFPFPNNYFP